MGALIAKCCGESDGETNDVDERTRLISATDVSGGDGSLLTDGGLSGAVGFGGGGGGAVNGELHAANGMFAGGGGAAGSLPKRANDDQAALTAILQDTANQVIDVSQAAVGTAGLVVQLGGAGGAAGLEAEYVDRAQEYGKRLSRVASALAAKHFEELSRERALADAPNGAPEKLLAAEAISEDDRTLIAEMTTRVVEAASDVQVMPPDDLVVPFV